MVLETKATLSPRDWNFVLTHAFKGTSRDLDTAKEILEAARRRSADVLVVRLICTAEELANRVATPERRIRFKEIDPEAARLNASLPLLDPGPHRAITIETSMLSAEATAERILLELPKPNS